VFCQIEGAPLWRSSCEVCGLVYKRTCLWVKPDGMPQLTGDRPGMGYEALVALHKPGRSQWNGGGKHGVYVIPKGSDGNTGRNVHPTQKPEALMSQLVADFTDDGDTILDPFAGSGTTLVSAKKLGRKAIGIEMNERHCESVARRLSLRFENIEGGLFSEQSA
jgi:site-specific DNA-methyltransferase (adenine-specific)